MTRLGQRDVNVTLGTRQTQSQSRHCYGEYTTTTEPPLSVAKSAKPKGKGLRERRLHRHPVPVSGADHMNYATANGMPYRQATTPRRAEPSPSPRGPRNRLGRSARKDTFTRPTRPSRSTLRDGQRDHRHAGPRRRRHHDDTSPHVRRKRSSRKGPRSGALSSPSPSPRGRAPDKGSAHTAKALRPDERYTRVAPGDDWPGVTTGTFAARRR